MLKYMGLLFLEYQRVYSGLGGALLLHCLALTAKNFKSGGLEHLLGSVYIMILIN